MRPGTGLVTGAAGFIGSHLCQRLIAEGWRVRGVDSFTSDYDPALKARNLETLAREPRFELIRQDLRTAVLPPLLEGVDVLWHLAARAGVRRSWGSSFEEYTSQNVNATQRLLEAARDRSPRRLVCASSSSVYGEAPSFPAAEDGPLRPISPYGVTKLAAEHLSRLYTLAYGLPTVSLRYFTVYGPRQRPDMAFHKFFASLLQGAPLTLYGAGDQTRDFTYIDDVTEANLRAAESGEPGQCYNISGGSSVSLREVIRLMEEITGRSARIERMPTQRGDPAHTGGDSSRARARLGYRPSVSLETGLRRMESWMRLYLEGRPE